MELAKIEQSVNLYHAALQSKRILDYEKKSDVLKEFSDIISKTYFDAGQKSDEATLRALCIGLYDEVKTFFRFIRMEELRLAFKNGVRGMYKGEKETSYIGMNIATFHGWIKGYLAEEKRKDALNAIKAANELPPAPLMSESEAEYAWKQTIKKQFAHFKESGHFVIEFPSHVFDRFEKIGLIKLSDEEKKPIYEEAKQKVCELKRLIRLNPKNRIEMNNATSFLNRVATNQLTKTDKQEIKSEARRIALQKYFEGIDELGL